jgi:hypothetical protein
LSHWRVFCPEKIWRGGSLILWGVLQSLRVSWWFFDGEFVVSWWFFVVVGMVVFGL